MAGRIFLNYRRGDAPDSTGRLYDRLEEEFGAHSLFMDVEGHIRPGDDFAAVLRHQVDQADVVLIVIGPLWQELLAQRTGSAEDFVSIEIKAALESNKRVIPVLVGGARMPAGDGLPADIRPLTYRHAVELRSDRFKADCQILIKALGEMLRNPSNDALAAATTAKPTTAAAVDQTENGPGTVLSASSPNPSSSNGTAAVGPRNAWHLPARLNDPSLSWKLLVFGIPAVILCGLAAGPLGLSLRTAWLFDEWISGRALSSAVLLALTIAIWRARGQAAEPWEIFYFFVGTSLWATSSISPLAQSLSCHSFDLCSDRSLMSDAGSKYDYWPGRIASILVGMAILAATAQMRPLFAVNRDGLAAAFVWAGVAIGLPEFILAVVNLVDTASTTWATISGILYASILVAGIWLLATRWKILSKGTRIVFLIGNVLAASNVYNYADSLLEAFKPADSGDASDPQVNEPDVKPAPKGLE
jgi:hypothetical protein